MELDLFNVGAVDPKGASYEAIEDKRDSSRLGGKHLDAGQIADHFRGAVG